KKKKKEKKKKKKKIKKKKKNKRKKKETNHWFERTTPSSTQHNISINAPYDQYYKLQIEWRSTYNA
ncbi:hypothetical protein, partial [Burkholderia sp. Ac-20379]|uniref:hypothetical protein n=1 Tax=Burkholderia sp. Ac-20379 TaxID=2703900 RepID=UPI00197ED654